MNGVHIKQLSDYKSMPWKNGLGNTLEITCCRDENGQRFRISQAKVIKDGYFSDFTGQHRTLVLLSGNGMKLEHKNSSSWLKSLSSIAYFSGEDKTYATLFNGPIEDLNIMVRESDTSAQVTKISSPQSIHLTNTKNSLLNIFYAFTPCTLAIPQVTKEKAIINCPAQSSIFFYIDSTTQNKEFELVDGAGLFIEVIDTDNLLS